jgi:hypothetical protein
MFVLAIRANLPTILQTGKLGVEFIGILSL